MVEEKEDTNMKIQYIDYFKIQGIHQAWGVKCTFHYVRSIQPILDFFPPDYCINNNLLGSLQAPSQRVCFDSLFLDLLYIYT